MSNLKMLPCCSLERRGACVCFFFLDQMGAVAVRKWHGLGYLVCTSSISAILNF